MTTADLRRIMSEDLAALRAGEITNSSARARAALAKTILQSVSVEIAAAQLGRHFEAIEIVSNDASNLRKVA
jgi:hypothetical protein